MSNKSNKVQVMHFNIQFHLLIKIINSWHVHKGGINYYAPMNLVFWQGDLV